MWTKVNTVVANQYILTAAYPLLNMLFLYVRAHPYLLMALTTLRHFDSYVVVMQPIVPLLPLNLFEVLVVQDSHPAHSLLNNTSWYFHSRKVYFCLKVKTHIRPVQCSAVQCFPNTILPLKSGQSELILHGPAHSSACRIVLGCALSNPVTWEVLARDYCRCST